MTAPDSVTTDIAAECAKARCRDVHPHRWEPPRSEGAQPDTACMACRSWGAHLAAAIAARLAERGVALLCSQCGEQLACMVKIGTADGWCVTCLDEASERGGEVAEGASDA